ncbi:non-ribosomal peptide synthetase [Cellvibrio sp. PSBB023]|uniref:non-ribosomal peptide synthetase n=1 Tax=Cellvibrio sp. PSBB023 TaxID=1945512 RepID=UPI00098F63C7|nr:non-ribosomal peptide synthetase [Cellvibrio sp. PSBB023]AQT62132.1 hypothetical protein B0D95_19965 [Cellvibrio sp. PSBB023]
MATDELRRKLAQRLAASRGLLLANDALGKNDGIAGRTIPVAPENREIPLSNAQERMWFLHRLDPAASAYNVCVLWHLHGNLDAVALQHSAEKITQRHSIFRTTYYVDENGNARQKILPHLPPDWHTEDISKCLPAEQEIGLQAIAQQASTAPFDLMSKSPLRLVLVKLNHAHHVLVMVGQHIVWDGPSFGIFSHELATGYNLFLRAQHDHPLPIPLQYVDFAYWHRLQWDINSEKRAAALAFWELQLSPLPEPLDFPRDFERGIVDDESGEWCTESLDKNVTATFLTFSTQEQLTPFEVIIAVIALLMTRLSRASEITIGTIASHRNLPELNNAIGNFGNVVPLRFSIASHWSFRELAHHCAKQCRLAFAHAEIPFEHLLDHLHIARGATRNPLLDTMVTFLSHGMESPTMDGLEVHWKKHFNGTSQIDLSFDALLHDGNLQLQATWRRALYQQGTVQNHMRRLVRLFETCVTTPDTRLSAHSVLLPEEYSQLISWGTRAALPSSEKTLVECFENRVRKLPDAIALASLSLGVENQQLPQRGISFAQLNARANKLARWLVAQGIGPEDRITIALPRRSEWFVAMLAILKAGAAFVPIDPSYPAEYIHRVITLAQPVLQFVDALEHSAMENSISLAVAEKAAEALGLANNDLSNTERRSPLQSAHPVCIVFTSGSTGAPKGVVVPHSAFVNLLTSHRNDLYHEAYRRTANAPLQIGHAWSLAFDASWQPTLWMIDGHTLHLLDVDTMQDPIALAREIILRRLDFIELTPGMLDEVLPWLQSGLTDASGQHLPAHLPTILAFGGESVKQALWDRILTLENTAGFNLYGPTEACVDSMIAKADTGSPPNIGGPIAGAQVYVLDSCLQLAPPGVAGELAIAGAGLARGYLQRGDLTATQFIANPHGQPGTRLYRTGDRVRWLPDGRLDYIGRIDEQVKVRGFRVEPLEVEATVEKLVQLPCAVVARKNSVGTMQLLCFVETGDSANQAERSTRALDADTLLQRLANNLPAHLLPAFVIPLPKLPHLPNGKINRRALVMPEGLDTAPGRMPRTALEQKLCLLFATVLGLEQVSIDDGFFELGGDSIAVIKLVSLARRDGITLTARQVFDSRSVARLAPLLVSPDSQGISFTNTHDNADTGLALPTPLMARYLSLDIPLQRFAQIVSLPLPSTITDDELEALLNALLQRHALLRARLIRPADSLPVLAIPAIDDSPPVQLQQLQGATNRDDTHAGRLARQLCDALDPTQGVMLAATRLYDGPDNQSTLWLAINHLVMDASSWHILASDLALGRLAQERHQPIHLPPVATAWRNWSAGLDPALHTQIVPAIYHGTLATAERMSWELPLHEGQCPAAAISRRLGLPLSSLLPALTALAVMQARLIPEQSSLNLVLEHHGRVPNTPNQDLSRTVGWFAREHLLPLPMLDTSSEDAESLSQLLRQWCSEIDSTKNKSGLAESSTTREWQLGFNFLGDIGTSGKPTCWTPQPRMDVLVESCGDHWPLLHDLDVSAHYCYRDDYRVLQFDAMGPAATINSASLQTLFATLQQLFDQLADEDSTQKKSPHSIPIDTQHTELKEVTPLQYEMLRQCDEENDPWTTQLELHLVSTPELPITNLSLQESAAQLFVRHQALRAGFLPNQAATFIPHAVNLDWQSLDWRHKPIAEQEELLIPLREEWYQHRFQLHRPPLLRFMAIRHTDNHWRLLVNSHHLLLDGWSVPRILNEWLGGACGMPPTEEPLLRWTNYLDELQTQERHLAQCYWNNSLQGLALPSLLRPSRHTRSPSKDVCAAISPHHSRDLINAVRAAGVSSASLYQLAWAKTLAVKLGHADVVFGLFDSGRAIPIDGVTSLVGLVTQLLPLRIDTANPQSIEAQLQALQARQFEWQAQAPVRLDNLAVAHRFGEFFDTLLIIENALDADAKMEAHASITPVPAAISPRNPLSLVREQRWRDSIGQVAGLFIYPGDSITLRLCYDPLAITPRDASNLLDSFKHQLQQLVNGLSSNAMSAAHSPAHNAHTPDATYNSHGD